MNDKDNGTVQVMEIEALRQIGNAQERLAEYVKQLREEIRADMKEDRRTLTDVRDRLIAIESNKVEPELAELRKDVDELKAEKNKRDGALGLTSWLFRNWPAVIGYAGLLFAMLKVSGKL